VASLRPQEDGSTLLARADAMLYRAKRNGKNCVQS
jgi:PleD family two-component response regulator